MRLSIDKNRFGMVCLIILLFAAHPASSKKDTKKDAARARVVQSRVNRIIPIIRTEPAKAIAELNKLLTENPGHKRMLLEKLGYAYTFAGKVDSAIAAYELCIGLSPMSITAARGLAQLYINRGYNDKANELFDQMIKRSPGKMHGYRAVAEAKSSAGWYSRALATYRQARVDLDDPDAFALEMGDLEKLTGNEEAALVEYLTYVHDRRRNMQVAKKKVLELVSNPKSDKGKLFKELEQQSLSGDPAYRGRVLEILSTVYLEEKLLEKALGAALEADRLPDANGKPLFALIGRLCENYERSKPAERGDSLDRCLRAVEAYLSRHPRAAEAPDAYLKRAALRAELGSGRVRNIAGVEREAALMQAVAGYDFVIQNFPGTRFAERAALQKGDLLFFYLKKPGEALAIYQRGARRAGEHAGSFAERIARTHIALGRESDASAYCTGLMQSRQKSLVETGYYYMGLLLAFTDEFEAARDTLASLAENNPASPYANDAIDIAWVIEAGKRKDPELLTRYMASLQAELAGDTTGTIELLEEFAEKPEGTPLRTWSLYRLGALRAAREQFDQALACFQGFLADYPDNSLAPDVERHIARIYETGLGEKKKALKTYEHVLMVYPGYVFLDEVRHEIMRLRSEEQVE